MHVLINYEYFLQFIDFTFFRLLLILAVSHFISRLVSCIQIIRVSVSYALFLFSARALTYFIASTVHCGPSHSVAIDSNWTYVYDKRPHQYLC